MGIYRDIGITEVAGFVAAIAMGITFFICIFLFPMILGHSTDAFCMAIIVMFIAGAITYIVFINHEFNAAPESDSRETDNKNVGRRKHRKTR